jgi:FkbM family methyltransferase
MARQIGLGRLLAGGRDLADAFCVHLSRPPLVAAIDGLKLFGYLRHRSFLESIATGTYEIFTRELFAKSLKPGITVVDAGAHIGLYSLLAARRMRGSGRIFAFEPDLYNFRALTFNINHIHNANVISLHKAVSNMIGSAFFYRSSGTIGSSLIKRSDIGRYEEIRVQTTTIDHELAHIKTDSLLVKIDIEGAEIKAIQGMKEILRTPKEITIISEINPSALEKSLVTSLDVVKEFKALGFKVCFIDELNKDLLPIENLDLARKGNLYCVRET